MTAAGRQDAGRDAERPAVIRRGRDGPPRARAARLIPAAALRNSGLPVTSAADHSSSAAALTGSAAPGPARLNLLGGLAAGFGGPGVDLGNAKPTLRFRTAAGRDRRRPSRCLANRSVGKRYGPARQGRVITPLPVR